MLRGLAPNDRHLRHPMPRTTATRCLGPLAAAVLLFVALPSHATGSPGGLTYFKNYFVTGDYVAAGVGLQHTGVNGFAKGTITIDPAQIPAGAEVVAAYLYWQTISSSGTPDPSALKGAKFKGNDISQIAVLLDKDGTAACGSGKDDDDRRSGSRTGSDRPAPIRRCRSWSRAPTRSRSPTWAGATARHRPSARGWCSSTASPATTVRREPHARRSGPSSSSTAASR